MPVECEENQIFVDCPACKRKQLCEFCKAKSGIGGIIQVEHDGNEIDLIIDLEVLKGVVKDKGWSKVCECVEKMLLLKNVDVVCKKQKVLRIASDED